MQTEHGKEKVSVTVTYVGRDDFVAEVAASEPLQAIKGKAMKKFELNPGDEDRYVLQFNGVDMQDATKVGTLGAVVVLKLMLKEEPAKGCSQ